MAGGKKTKFVCVCVCVCVLGTMCGQIPIDKDTFSQRSAESSCTDTELTRLIRDFLLLQFIRPTPWDAATASYHWTTVPPLLHPLSSLSLGFIPPSFLIQSWKPPLKQTTDADTHNSRCLLLSSSSLFTSNICHWLKTSLTFVAQANGPTFYTGSSF